MGVKWIVGFPDAHINIPLDVVCEVDGWVSLVINWSLVFGIPVVNLVCEPKIMIY
jgi:hypothetical protein